MGSISRLAIALAMTAATAAFGADASPCASEPAMNGLRERITSLQDQMDRIEWTTDRAEHERLMDLHMKLMQEGMREIRHRELGTACRMDVMGSMMELIIRHQHAMHAPEERR